MIVLVPQGFENPLARASPRHEKAALQGGSFNNASLGSENINQ